MAKTRERKPIPVDDWNCLPLLVEYFGPVKTGSLFAFVIAWHLSGEPAPKECDERTGGTKRVRGYSRASVYQWHADLQGFRRWLATKGFAWDDARELARDLALRALPQNAASG
jgi:hypothetical protein